MYSKRLTLSRTLANKQSYKQTQATRTNSSPRRGNKDDTMDNHTKAVSKSFFYHIRSFRQIRSSRDDSTALSVATALVSGRLDYANSILFGCPLKYCSRLQQVWKALSRVTILQNSSFPTRSTTALLRHLHWLATNSRISFKLYNNIQSGGLWSSSISSKSSPQLQPSLNHAFRLRYTTYSSMP